MGIKSFLILSVLLSVFPSAFAQDNGDEIKAEVAEVINEVGTLANSTSPVIVKKCRGNEEDRELSPFEKFKAKVVAGKFRTNQNSFEAYSYYGCKEEKSNILEIFTLHSFSCSSNFERRIVEGKFVHEFGSTEEEIKLKLKEIIEANTGDENSYLQNSPNIFSFISGQYSYVINTDYPAFANPVARKDLQTGEVYSLTHGYVLNAGWSND